MLDADSRTDPVDDLAEEFARRCRDGERPSVEEYVQRYPHWADEIRELFPSVLLMEQLKPRREDNSTTPIPPKSSSPIPERLGEYRLLREIGRGGMGVVFEAEHEALRRRVAIKVLPAHLFADDKLRARFRRESQAAARLHHTNIVPVFDTGEQDGLHYYVMQLIAARSLEVARNETATLPLTASSPPSATVVEQHLLSHRHIAQLGMQVADALAYAHAQGVLHRDVKPSNLLLDEAGTVWVTDFGVAKLVEEANLTGSGDIVGTLRYMPPERFGGHSDARGDVYSLGITLYELLARRPAFPDTTPQHLIQLITQTDTTPLRGLDAAIPTDLETIVLKAAARDSATRYQTAAELADDLRRFLDDRPIKARRIGVVEQAWRWCRRNRLVAGLAAAAVGLMLLTSVVSVAAALLTAAAQSKTEAANGNLTNALAAEQVQRERAEKTSAAALEAMNRIYDRFTPNRIIVAPTLPANGSSEEEIAIPPQPTLPPEAVPLLEQLLDFYEQFAREGGDHPRLQHQAAAAEQHIGDIRQRLGQLDAASAAYRKALELYRVAPAEGRDETMPIKLARTYNELGRTLAALQRTADARDAHGQAFTVLAAASKECSSRPECRFELARTYYFQSQREFLGEPPPPGPARGPGHGPDGGPGRGPDGGRGRSPGQRPDGPPPRPPTDADQQTLRRAIVILEPLIKEHDKVPEYRHLLACCYRDARQRGPRSIDATTDPAVKLLRKLANDFPKVPDFSYDLGETLARLSTPGGMNRGDEDTARKQLEEAATIADKLADDYPTVPLYAASRALVYDRLGELHEQMGQRDKAEQHFHKAVDLQTTLARQHPEVVAYDLTLARLQRSLARMLSHRKEYNEARVLLDGSADKLEALLKRGPNTAGVRFSLGRTERDLADVLGRLGENDLAAKALRRAEEFGPERRGGPFGPPPN